MEKHPIRKLIIFFISLIVFIVLMLLYSRFIGTKNINIKEYKIVNNNFSDDYYGLKIVHITDIHYGKITFEKELKELVKKVNRTKPDIIVFTGDLIDKDTKLSNEDADKIASILSNMNARVGKYAISGDNDTKFNNYELMIENSGFKLLNEKYDTIFLENNRYILITGLSSNLNSKNITEKISSSENYLKDKKEEELPMYSILIMHEPDYISDINIKNYNLILAGHSLNGQVRLPIIGPILFNIPKGAKKYYNPHYKIKNTDLYISSGIGTSTSNFRLFNRPSFNLYRFTNK